MPPNFPAAGREQRKKGDLLMFNRGIAGRYSRVIVKTWREGGGVQGYRAFILRRKKEARAKKRSRPGDQAGNEEAARCKTGSWTKLIVWGRRCRSIRIIVVAASDWISRWPSESPCVAKQCKHAAFHEPPPGCTLKPFTLNFYFYNIYIFFFLTLQNGYARECPRR